ncbi:Ribonuclease HI-related protein [Alternaria alternata]|nr:Ribonuclease HI-related protein [Alternaria alternata]
MVKKYHAVTRGKRPGLYNSFEEAQQEVIGFPGSKVKTFPNLKFAVEHMLDVGRVPDDDIRVFNRAFIKQGSFIPQPSNSKNEACVDAIRDEIIYHYLPEGLHYRQVNHPRGQIRLDDGQKLLIYQRVCEQTGKRAHSLIQECIDELKDPPYVNILDFVDVFRTGETIRTFSDPLIFRDYTRENPIYLKYAKKSEFLCPFLQDLQELRRLPSKPRRDRQVNGSRQESRARKDSALLLSPRPGNKFVKPEMSNDSHMVPPVGNYQSSLDHPPLSPPLSESGSEKPSTNVKIEPTSSVMPAQVLDDIGASLEDDKEIATQLLQQPSKAEVGQDIPEDMFQDDEEISTQLSQQPSKAEVGEDISEDMLEYMIQDDKEISTQLTQEWHITGPEESSRTKTTGKRKQSLASDLTHTVKRAGKMLKTHR